MNTTPQYFYGILHELEVIDAAGTPKRGQIFKDALSVNDSGIRRKALDLMGPTDVDNSLSEVVLCMADPDQRVTENAFEKSARHPLLGLSRRSDIWIGNDTKPEKIYFPPNQIKSVNNAFHILSQQISIEQREILTRRMANLDGLANVVEFDSIAPLSDFKYKFKLYRQHRQWQQFPIQLMQVITYRCNMNCSYCFTSKLDKRYTEDFTVEQFNRVLEWAVRSGVDKLPVTGGEPTLNPKFLSMVKMVHRKGLKTYFSSNLLGPDDVYAELPAEAVDSVTVHILDDEVYRTEGIYSRVTQNIQHLINRQIPLIFRFVIDRPGHKQWETLMKLAERFRPTAVSFSPAFPRVVRYSGDGNVSQLFDYKRDIIDLLMDLKGINIPSVFAKPLPLCMFDREELLWVMATSKLKNICEIHQNGYTNNLLINPDLSISPCMVIPSRGEKLTDFSSLDAICNRNRREVEPLLGIPMTENCLSCQLWDMRICQPACLSYVLPLIKGTSAISL